MIIEIAGMHFSSGLVVPDITLYYLFNLHQGEVLVKFNRQHLF